ncbi:MAG TPA: inositol monophosphatase family protein [Fimbriimonas sp.]|nr:inositol monophosphatase family protein [Fimbriimonas sp.]
MSPRLAFAVDAATVAGRFTLAHFQTGVARETKADETPVTVADKGAERIIRELIAEAFPGEHILGEEEGGDAQVPDRWVVDPIDGTKSFVSGVPLYATLISYERDFQPVLGVAFFPALDELLYAGAGEGTYWNGRVAQVSTKKEIAGSVVCCGGHRSMIKHGRWPGFEKIAAQAMATRTWSDAYGHALVATGRVEAMVDPIVTRWDLSAMAIIVEEAGGKFTSFDGSPSLVRKDDLQALSSNGLVHRELIEAFSG